MCQPCACRSSSLDLEGIGVHATEDIAEGATIYSDSPVLRWRLVQKPGDDSADEDVCHGTIEEVAETIVGKEITDNSILYNVLEALQEESIETRPETLTDTGGQNRPFSFFACAHWVLRGIGWGTEVVGEEGVGKRHAECLQKQLDALKPYRSSEDRKHLQEVQDMVNELLVEIPDVAATINSILRYHRVVQFNAFVQKSAVEPCGSEFLTLYPFLSRVNHSCKPNAWMTSVGELVALRSIPKDEEITWNYRQSSTEIGISQFQEEFGFHCHCEVCRR